ncbi:MAG: ATP-dependent zinc metalloprotease FtsH [Patescibacteria group bacterium]
MAVAKKPNRPDLIKKAIYLVVVLIIIGAFLSFYNSSTETIDEIGLGELVQKINNEEVKNIEVQAEQNLNVLLNDDTKLKAQKETSESLTTVLENYGVSSTQMQNIDILIKNESGWSFWLSSLLPFLIPFLLIVGIIYLFMRQVQGSSNKAMMFGQSKARETSPKDKKNKITFKQVAGVIEAKEELKEVVEFLKHPKKFAAVGAKVPKGVLLLGPPGTGKTLLARAVAGEASVPFFHISGSEFVEMFVGVGASRVRDLFKKAKKGAPAIVFIDEIDAVGRQRGTGLGGSHDEREQTLNQILVEMDGFEPDTGVIVVAATNRPDVLDPALLRPGRFDRRVILDMPDIKDREGILKVHAGDKPLTKDVNLRDLAERTPGFSGADLANLLNEAAILTARRNKKEVSMAECLESIEKVLLGPERKSSLLSKKEKRITAYHEAGHALVARMTPASDPVRKVSIVSRGQAAGYTLKLPIEDKHLHSRTEFMADLAVFLAGHATEKKKFGELTTGATNDLRQATRLARKLVTEFGMSDTMGPRTFGEKEELVFLGREISEQRDYSDDTAKKIDDEINKIIDQAYKMANSVLAKNSDKLEEVAEQLIEVETLEQEEFEAIFSKNKKEINKKEAV